MNMKYILYIIFDKRQEKSQLESLARYGAKWRTGEPLDEVLPSENFDFKQFPYSLIVDSEDLTAYYHYDAYADLDTISEITDIVKWWK